MSNQSKGIKRILSFAGRYRGLLTFARCLSGISALFIIGPFICVYFAARELIAVFLGDQLNGQALLNWGLFALGLELVGVVLYFLALLSSHIVAFHIQKNLQMAALRHLAHMFVIMSVGLAVLDWRMALCIIVPVPVASIVVVLARKAQSKAELENLEAKRCAYDAVQEYIDTIKELKAYSKTDVYLDELDKKLENVIRCSFRNELAPGASTTAAQFILRFGLVAVLLIGGNLVIEGMLSIPMLILFLLFAGRIYDPFTNCFMLLAEVFAALVSIGRMKQIDNTQEQTGSDCCNNIGCDIEFKDVYFSYNEEPVLTGVSFVAKQGEITALVGPSGSGKSTVSKLAARFWDADSGLITLGGIDVKTVEPEVLLKNYAIVFQNVTLFDESVMENIRLGRSGASDEDVRAAAKAAQCDEFIDRLPQGYDTNIGENGSKLSGGERQRISIARALLKNAPVILLDEATASMDAESETMVQTALSALLKGRTVIVIAHRMRTIANADKIVVLDKGKVTEVGTPSELAKKGGLYAHLVALQQKQQMSSLPT